MNRLKTVILSGIRSRLSKIRELKLYSIYHVHILNGRKIYLKLVEKFGEDCRIYINHYPGTGDVFLTASLLPVWAEKHGVGNYVFTVIGKNAFKVANLFPLKNVCELNSLETEDLLFYLQAIGETDPNIEVLHFDPFAFHQKIIFYLMGENDINFLDMYLNVTFPGLTMKDMLPYEDKTTDEEILEIFAEKKLIPGKTVLLVPYAKTIDLLSESFWNYLAEELIKKGYTVCTNCDYPKERKIRNTVPIFLKYTQMKKFVEIAGTIIQLRSGLTDLLYNCDCRNIVLYPVENSFRFGSASLYEYFSLKRMGLSDKTVEIEFSRQNEWSVMEQILRDLDKNEADYMQS